MKHDIDNGSGEEQYLYARLLYFSTPVFTTTGYGATAATNLSSMSLCVLEIAGVVKR